MDFKLFTKIVDEASKYGARSFSLHIFGEPLLYRYWMTAIKYIKMKNQRHIVLLTSNGTKVNEYIDLLLHLPIDKFLWSWRKEAKFTPETVKKLKAWKPFTVRYIEGTYPPEALEEKWPKVEKRRMHNYGGNVLLNQSLNHTSTDVTNRWACYHLWLAPAVSWNGKFLMCCALPHHEEIIGDVQEKTIAEMWQGQKLKSIRKSHLDGQYSGVCEKCDVWKEYPNLFFGHEYASS